MNRGVGIYPELFDKDFDKKITNKKEFWDNGSFQPKNLNQALLNHQKLLSNFINPLTPYNSLLVYHKVGLGKTRVAISIAENFKHEKHIVIIIKNDILEINFINEIINNDYGLFRYADKEYYTETKNDIRDTLYKEAVKKIKKYYSFVTFGTILSKHNKTLFSKSLILVDEAHNLTGDGETYTEFIKQLQDSSNITIVLLTGTPVYDSVTEIFQISNILNCIDKNAYLFPKINILESEGIIFKENKRINNILTKSPYFLTDLGKSMVLKSLHGKVSYLESDETGFAKKRFNGTPIYTGSSIKITRCAMSPFQDNIYANTFEKDKKNPLFKDQSDSSSFVFPDSRYGIEGFNNNITKKSNIDFFKSENIGEYSSKLLSLLKNIKESKGPVFVYSNYVTHGGTDLIKLTLLENGYSTFSVGRIQKNKILVFNKNLTLRKRKQYLEIFNSKENIDGSIIKIIIGSPVISEGISLKNIRQIHIFDPHWNFSRIDQIIGRGIRFKSHSDLPAKDRIVDIFLYAAVSKIKDSIDVCKYQLSYLKDMAIKDVEYSLKKIAFDCFLNKTQNIKSEDYSRQCQYKPCNYTCNYEKKDYFIDDTTYDLKVHDKSKYTYIEKKIKGIFTTGYVFDIKKILSFVKKNYPELEEQNIFIVLNEMINSNCSILNASNIKSNILAVGNYYITNPCNDKLSDEFFYKIFQKYKTNKSIQEIFNIRLSKHKKISKEYKKLNLDNKGVFATLSDNFGKKDNIFRIIDNRDPTKIPSGRVCSSLSKEELKNILKFFNLPPPIKITRENMCYSIYHHMLVKKLLI